MYTVKGVRKTLGINQIEMANLMGMKQTGISRLEMGTRKETIIQERFLSSLIVLNRHNLIPEMLSETQMLIDMETLSV